MSQLRLLPVSCQHDDALTRLMFEFHQCGMGSCECICHCTILVQSACSLQPFIRLLWVSSEPEGNTTAAVFIGCSAAAADCITCVATGQQHVRRPNKQA